MGKETNYLEVVLGDNPEALKAIREIPLLKNCSEALQKLIFKYGKVFSLRNGENLTTSGEYDQWVYFILTGRLGVFVGDEWVDTVSSSLVGERCIFGEPRCATLKAGQEGVTAIGVDMALLDSLRDSEKQIPKSAHLFSELILIIVGEIVKRIAEFEYTQLDITQKYNLYIKGEEISAIIYNLKNNYYREDPKISRMINDYMLEKLKQAEPGGRKEGTRVVDIKNFYATCISEGRHDFLFELSEKIKQELGHSRNIIPVKKQEPMDQFTYNNFINMIGNEIYVYSKKLKPDLALDLPQVQAGVRKALKITSDYTINLDKLNEWFEGRLGLNRLESIKVLMVMLKKASDYTIRINERLNYMLNELSRVKSNRLEMASANLNINVQEYYGSKSPNEMIPFYSQKILDSFIIQPYFTKLEELGMKKGA